MADFVLAHIAPTCSVGHEQHNSLLGKAGVAEEAWRKSRWLARIEDMDEKLPKPFQFSLRTLLLTVTASAVLFAALRTHIVTGLAGLAASFVMLASLAFVLLLGGTTMLSRSLDAFLVLFIVLIFPLLLFYFFCP